MATVVIATVAITVLSMATVAMTTVAMTTVALETVAMATVAMETVVMAMVAIATVSMETVAMAASSPLHSRPSPSPPTFPLPSPPSLDSGTQWRRRRDLFILQRDILYILYFRHSNEIAYCISQYYICCNVSLAFPTYPFFPRQIFCVHSVLPRLFFDSCSACGSGISRFKKKKFKLHSQIES